MRETVEKHKQKITEHKKYLQEYENHIKLRLNIFLKKQRLFEETDYYISILGYHQIRLKSLSTQFIKKYPNFEQDLNDLMQCKGDLQIKNQRIIFKYYSLVGENMDSMLEARFRDKRIDTL